MTNKRTKTYRVDYYYLATGMDKADSYVYNPEVVAKSAAEAVELCLDPDDPNSDFLRSCLTATHIRTRDDK